MFKVVAGEGLGVLRIVAKMFWLVASVFVVVAWIFTVA